MSNINKKNIRASTLLKVDMRYKSIILDARQRVKFTFLSCLNAYDAYANKLLAAMKLLRYKWLILDILVDKE